MTQHITTGPHPGHNGGCMAQYNHSTHSHNPAHYTATPTHNPYTPQPNPGYYGAPPQRPPGTSYPWHY